MKKHLITLVIIAIATISNAQDKYCDQGLNDRIKQFSDNIHDATFLKDFSTFIPKTAEPKLEKKFTMLLSQNTVYRIALLSSDNFKGYATLSIDGPENQPVKPDNILSVSSTKGKFPATADFEISKTGAYTISLIENSGNEACATFVLYYVRSTNSNGTTANTDTMYYVNVDLNASFQGSDIASFKTYVANNITFSSSINSNVPTKPVYIQFNVTPDGIVTNALVLRSSGNVAYDNEAVKVILSSPKWEPAKIGKRKVGQTFVLPVKFQADK